MKHSLLAAVGLIVLAALPARAGLFGSSSSSSSDTCANMTGDYVLSARTDQVDLYSDPQGSKKAETLEQKKFPTCIAIIDTWPNAMMQIQVDGQKYWVEPHMVHYKLVRGSRPVCRHLAMGNNQVKAGATRGLGEGCK